MRGEYGPGAVWGPVAQELPPRARRIQDRPKGLVPYKGTTSACAENTMLRNPPPKSDWNYLRVRGEYDLRMSLICDCGELPPRARRIPILKEIAHKHGRTTSACAENTGLGKFSTSQIWNYLRVRGEYASSTCMMSMMVELPPRARRIPPKDTKIGDYIGTTSACAENTHRQRAPAQRFGNYLRVRGEYGRW